MDPNETLQDLRDAIRRYESDGDDADAAAAEMSVAASALDFWLSKGGFLPDDWER